MARIMEDSLHAITWLPPSRVPCKGFRAEAPCAVSRSIARLDDRWRRCIGRGCIYRRRYVVASAHIRPGMDTYEPGMAGVVLRLWPGFSAAFYPQQCHRFRQSRSSLPPVRLSFTTTTTISSSRLAHPLPLLRRSRMPTLLWRRRTSTPLFPGAWPNSSSSDHSDDQRLPVYNDDAPPQLPELKHLGSRKDALNSRSQEDPVALAEEGWGFSIVSEQYGFEDNGRVVGARDRARYGSQPASMSSPVSTNAPLSGSLSQASIFSDPTVSATTRTRLRRIYRLPRRIPRAS